jgi:hypothetical protein
LTALPLGDGPAADELLGHAIAALDARWVFLADRAVSGQEQRLRRFAGILRSLPAWPSVPLGAQADPSSRPFGVAVRRMGDDVQTFLEIANDSPYPIRLAALLDAPGSAPVEDLGRNLRLSPAAEAGGRNLVLDLLPYGVSAIRVGAPRVQLSAVTPYPSEPVLTTMQSRFNELSAQLARLNHGLASPLTEPANPGFEPDAALETRLPGQTVLAPARTATNGKPASAVAQAVPAGWRLESKMAGSVTIAIDGENPHGGHGRRVRLRSSATRSYPTCNPTSTSRCSSAHPRPDPRFASGSKVNQAAGRTSGARSWTSRPTGRRGRCVPRIYRPRGWTVLGSGLS